jgi:chromosome partitioning protein
MDGARRASFKIADERQAARYARDYEHTIIDTEAHPSTGDLRTLVGGCDLLVIPTTPDGLSLHALMQTVSALDALGADRYRVLLTIVPPRPNRDGDEARKC